jgi:Flp pilus assembly protein TadD
MESGFLLRDLGRSAEAAEVFQGVQALLPTSEVPEVALGLVAFQLGDFEAAGKHYRRALQLNPRSAWAHAHLGELCLFQMDKDGARTALRTALALDARGVHGQLARVLLDLTEAVSFR